MKAISCLGAALLLLNASARAADQKWSIHEWGTFTSLQNENGDALGGINTDDEAVPQFVHRLTSAALLWPTEVPRSFFKGAPACHPDVTMRLETPVIYFHPPISATGIQQASVDVKFRGGWLTEFYPNAQASAPGFNQPNERADSAVMTGPLQHINSATESELRWNNLAIGGDWPLTNTTAHVWTSPRAVQCASVQTADHESEKFLFYRGIAHIDAPLRVSRDAASGELLFRSQLENLPTDQSLAIRSMWLVDIQADGQLAFRALSPVFLQHNSKAILTHTPAQFQSSDYSRGNLEKLEASLHDALVADGLFPDEAQALLNTWQLSYFKSAGLRVFFLVPRTWTDYYLPLHVSVPADLNRVMVGRIELVTPEQRNLLHQIDNFTSAKIQLDAANMRVNFNRALMGNNKAFVTLDSGKGHLSSVMFVPKTYQAYLDLGRFRNALILDEAAHHPTTGVTNFIATYSLQGYKPAETLTASAFE